MKKLVFMALVVVFMVSSGFVNLKNEMTSFTDRKAESYESELTVEIEYLYQNSFDEIPCARKTCYYRDGVQTGCTEWEYGDCGVDDNGNLVFAPYTLEPVIIAG